MAFHFEAIYSGLTWICTKHAHRRLQLGAGIVLCIFDDTGAIRGADIAIVD